MKLIVLEQIGSSRPWVARILGKDAKWGLARTFLSGITDREGANSAGSRGVFTTYELHDGAYEISSPESWKRTDRYFALIANGELRRVTAQDILQHIENGRSPETLKAEAVRQ
jgi:hypothetical protein